MTESVPTEPGDALVCAAVPLPALPELPADADFKVAAAEAGSVMVLPAPLTIVTPPGAAAAADPVLSAVSVTAVAPARASAMVANFRDLPLRGMGTSSS